MKDRRAASSLWVFGSAGLLVSGLSVALSATRLQAAPEPALPEQAGALISARCLSCHNAEKKAGDLDLSSRATAVATGVIAPQNPTKSRLLHAVEQGKMPPTGKLAAEEVSLLRKWIASGAAYPRERLEPIRVADMPLWSLQPLRHPKPPRTAFASLAKTPVDEFIFAQLATKGLRPSKPASRLQWLRRVTVDLTGLPPTPEEVDAFVADRSPMAYEKVVDRLLASRAYGERWGQQWLDVVRYGESHGYEQNHLRPSAWPYRDYVIKSFNDDKPYDRFIKEQLAGDVIGKGDPDAEIGTGFLVAGVHDTVGNQTEEGTRLQRANDLDDMVATTAETFLALTAGCAKCHDHKFDPVPQRDYYRLAAVFAGVRHGERDLPLASGANRLPGFSVQGLRRTEQFAPVMAKFVRFTVLSTADGAEPCLDELEVYSGDRPENLALATNGARASASSLLPGYAVHQVEHLNDGKLGNSQSWISNERGSGWAQIELPSLTRINRVIWSRDASPEARFTDRQANAWRIDVSEDGKSWKPVVTRDKGALGNALAVRRAYIGTFSDPDPMFVLRRGDVMQRTEAVGPAALSRISGYSGELFSTGPSSQPTETERRVALANWIANPKNPLTARVMVNRVWQGHFGRGLVGTPSDFGHNGEKPSHPELLDWLANDFMGGSWKIKRLHKLICLSYTYRQSSDADPKGLATDAGNQLLWRMPLRRMEAEAVRDAILTTSGKLSLKMGGPSFQLYKYRVVNVAIYEPLEQYGPETWRRSVYRQAARGIRDDLLGTFDCPESAQRTPRRPSTTTALQALSLLNGPFMTQQAGFFAERVQSGAEKDVETQVTRAYRLAFGRAAEAGERKAAAELVRKHGLASLCRALMNANEFLYY